MDELAALADAACRAAIVRYNSSKQCEFTNEPVNWASLGVSDIEYYKSRAGTEGYRVRIEEAAPGCENLCGFIAKFLAGRGYPDIDVVTEW